MNITPDQARALLDGATPGPWCLRETDVLMNARAFHIRKVGQPGIRVSATTYGHNDDPELIAAAPDMAETIAGMTELWAVEEMADDGGWWRITVWHANRPDAEHFLQGSDRRLVRRLVGPVETVEES